MTLFRLLLAALAVAAWFLAWTFAGRRLRPAPGPVNFLVAGTEALVRALPESPLAWYYLGDHHFHYGGLSERPNSLAEASIASLTSFRRNLDTVYGPCSDANAQLCATPERAEGTIDEVVRFASESCT